MPWHEGSIRVLGTQERCWTRAEQSRGISDGGGLGWRNGGRELQHKAGAGGGAGLTLGRPLSRGLTLNARVQVQGK